VEGDPTDKRARPDLIDEKPVGLETDEQAVEFTWTPAETGRFVVDGLGPIRCRANW